MAFRFNPCQPCCECLSAEEIDLNLGDSVGDGVAGCGQLRGWVTLPNLSGMFYRRFSVEDICVRPAFLVEGVPPIVDIYVVVSRGNGMFTVGNAWPQIPSFSFDALDGCMIIAAVNVSGAAASGSAFWNHTYILSGLPSINHAQQYLLPRVHTYGTPVFGGVACMKFGDVNINVSPCCVGDFPASLSFQVP